MTKERKVGVWGREGHSLTRDQVALSVREMWKKTEVDPCQGLN